MSILSRQTGFGPLKGGLSKKRPPRHKQDQVLLEKIPFRKLVIVSLVISFATITAVLFLQDSLPPQIPLFYGLPKTQEQLTTSFGLIIPSTVSLGIIMINLLIVQALRDDFLRKVLTMAGVAGIFFSTITTIKIISLVGVF